MAVHSHTLFFAHIHLSKIYPSFVLNQLKTGTFQQGFGHHRGVMEGAVVGEELAELGLGETEDIIHHSELFGGVHSEYFCVEAVLHLAHIAIFADEGQIYFGIVHLEVIMHNKINKLNKA